MDFPHCLICGTVGQEPDQECQACGNHLELCVRQMAQVNLWLDQLHKVRDFYRGRIQDHMGEPGVREYSDFKVSWRRYQSSRLDIQNFRRQDPENYARFSQVKEVDQVYVDPIRR